ncbi:MAG TPA: methyltransferase domain-containing protein, partial [Acidimicrobiia bacterium]|nr:methyltransferase domain-containing protein [Acidimicrobiia bacterium]
PFIGAVGERYPGVDARTSSADDLPFDNDEFDVTLAQLVVHFMPDPVAGLAEMARVTRDGGVVVACVWDHGGGQGPLRSFWKAAREIDPGVDDESHLPGVRQGDLGEIFREAGLQHVEESSLTVSLQHPSFDEWWEPFTLGVGPAGDFAATLDPTARARLRELCRKFLPPPPFVVTGKAWAARGIV